MVYDDDDGYKQLQVEILRQENNHTVIADAAKAGRRLGRLSPPQTMR